VGLLRHHIDKKYLKIVYLRIVAFEHPINVAAAFRAEPSMAVPLCD
jgi:hypothetical protein